MEGAVLLIVLAIFGIGAATVSITNRLNRIRQLKALTEDTRPELPPGNGE